MSNSNQVKIVGQKCIGYQRDGEGKINTVIENTVKLEKGVKTDWCINYANGSVSLPLSVRPRIDIAP